MMKALLFFLSIIVSFLSIAKEPENLALHIYNSDLEKPITIFSHGVSADFTQADFYKTLFCSCNYIGFNYPNAPEKLFARNHLTGLAQASEMKSLDYVIDIACDYDQPVILYGLSRGASTIINVVGSRVAHKKRLPNIRAIILESPFAHCEDVVNGYAKQFRLPPFFMRFLVKRFFKEYDRQKNAPIDLIHFIPQNIPILFVCTIQDTIVPVESTRRLYTQLQRLGHMHVHMLEVPDGIHANLVWSIHGRAYQTVLQAFYRAYDLPHDNNIAELGQERFMQC